MHDRRHFPVQPVSGGFLPSITAAELKLRCSSAAVGWGSLSPAHPGFTFWDSTKKAETSLEHSQADYWQGPGISWRLLKNLLDSEKRTKEKEIEHSAPKSLGFQGKSCDEKILREPTVTAPQLPLLITTYSLEEGKTKRKCRNLVTS